MPVFAYTALDRNGRGVSGTIAAESRAAAMDRVVVQGLCPVSLQERQDAAPRRPLVRWRSGSARIPPSAVESFTRELANLLAAGLPLSRALHLLGREASHPGAARAWSAVHDDVIGGMPLADALAKWPGAFSGVYVAMVRAGEAGGFLHVVLQQIADFRAREQELKGRVKAALVYPCALVLLASAVMVFLLTFFIPRFSGVFADFGGRLPWLTRAIVAASRGLMEYGLGIGVGAVIAGVGVRRAASTEAGRRWLERLMLRAPLLGKVAARFALVRFARMLGTLVSAGVPLVASLRVAREALGNQTLADAVSHAIDQVQRGEALSRSLAGNTLLFPPSVIEMIAVAEETGRLGQELVRLSAAYEGELDRNLRMLVALVEPALLFLMAGLIGTMVVGMLLPVFTLQELVK